MRRLPLLFSIAIAIGVLYLTIWPHEVGHSATAYLFGCKASWWRTDFSWVLWGSFSGAYEPGCLEQRGAAAVALTAFAGSGVNLLILALAPLLGGWMRADPTRSSAARQGWFLTTFWWALANYAEAFSYLVVCMLWLKSDMLTLVEATGVSRWIWLAGSLPLAALTALWLRRPARTAAAILDAPGPPRRATPLLFVLYVVLVGGAMVAARVLLT